MAREMRHQAEEERQIALRDALLIERQEERALGGVQQEVGVLDALGDALVGEQFADVVSAEEVRKLVGGNVGVDRHVKLFRSRFGPQRARQREELVLLRGRDRLDVQRESARRRRP